jgi:hypothetical protein
MGWSGKVVDRGMDFLRTVAYHSMRILMSITRERERERLKLVAELPYVFRVVFRELLVLAVPIEKKD